MAVQHDATPLAAVEGSSALLARLYDHLDNLWIEYLSYVKTYTAAQEDIQQHLSSGFFSLARANFTGRNGRRHGKDYYHDRAVATKRVSIAVNEDYLADVRILGWGGSSETTPDNRAVNEDIVAGTSSLIHSITTTTDLNDVDLAVDHSKTDKALDDDSADLRPEKKTRPSLETVPLRWFGLLVPQELRDAQASFSTVFDRSLAESVNAARRMRETETQIRKTRKEIRKAERPGLQ